MPRISNYERAIEIFEPNKKGFSRWVTKEELDRENFSWGNNGVFRHGVYRGVKQFKWEKFPPPGSIEKIRMVGFNKEDVWMQGINDSIKKELIENTPYCNLSLVPLNSSLIDIDHRYGNKRNSKVIKIYKDIENQKVEDFQVLHKTINTHKRQMCKVCMDTGKRPKHPEKSFIEGTEDWDDNVLCKGCYLAEPERYR